MRECVCVFLELYGNMKLEVLKWPSHEGVSWNVMFLCYFNTNVLMFAISWGFILFLRDERYMMQ